MLERRPAGYDVSPKGRGGGLPLVIDPWAVSFVWHDNLLDSALPL